MRGKEEEKTESAVFLRTYVHYNVPVDYMCFELSCENENIYRLFVVYKVGGFFSPAFHCGKRENARKLKIRPCVFLTKSRRSSLSLAGRFSGARI